MHEEDLFIYFFIGPQKFINFACFLITVVSFRMSSIGFENANEPCCGGYFPPFICFKSSGTNRSSALCTDRLKYVFWFAYHPTEAANMIIAKRLLDGDGSVSYPINIRKLKAVGYYNMAILGPVCSYAGYGLC
ncbi:unnamed protein product [Prunus brigantina]